MKKLLLFLLLTLPLFAQELKKVSLQLMWLDQFQFAGYYMAQHKGFYREAGLDVDIRTISGTTDALEEVMADRATFGIGRSNLIRARSEGQDVVLLSAILQSSPLVLITNKVDEIDSIHDFDGKKLMVTMDYSQTVSIDAMMRSHGIDEDNYEREEHSFDLMDLVDGKVDLYASYISNEPFILDRMGVEYKVFAPKDHGFDFYSDILFTTQEMVKKDPQMVDAFNKASLKGWEYAFKYMDETIEYIYKYKNSQGKSKEAIIFEAEELKKLAYYQTNTLGSINVDKLRRIYDIYRVMGFIKGSVNYEDFIFHPEDALLSAVEKAYLKKKKKIKICVLPDSLPYSALRDGEFVGVGAELLAETKGYLDIEYEVVPTKTWVESLQKGFNSECDLLPIAEKTQTRSKYFRYTTPYHYEPLVVVTNEKGNYILDFETVLDQEFSIVQGQSFIEKLKYEYPEIKLRYVQNTQEGLQLVRSEDVYGHIDVLVGAAYALKNLQHTDLQISSQFSGNVAVSFATRQEDIELFEIYEKIAKEIKPSDVNRLLNNWVSVNYTQEVSFQYLQELIWIFFMIVGAFGLRQYILNKKNDELEALQLELVDLNKSLEDKVLQATEELHKAQEIAKMGSWILDMRTGDLRWSDETYRIFEIERENDKEMLYKRFLERVHPEDRLMLENTYKHSLDTGEAYRLKHRLRMDDGSIKYVLEQCETTYDNLGTPIVSHGTVQDITQETYAKLEMEQKDAYLLHQSRLAQMGEMMSMIAHQWKQPLSSIAAIQIAIKMSIELEKYDLTKIEERKAFITFLEAKLEHIGNHVHHLSQIIKDFSDFYKPNKSAEHTYLDITISKGFSLIEDSLRANGIDIELDLSSKYEVSLYCNEFMQVLLNLLSNSKDQILQSKMKDGRIIIRSFDEGDYACLVIRDNAGGIDEEIIAKIFDPYFSTKLEKNGTGLGLYMSKTIINDYHGGEIYAQNKENGAMFTIKIKKLVEESRVDEE